MLILVGASASGKTLVAKELFKKYKIKKAITHTTREKRIGEQDDVDYHFVSKDTFLDLINKNSFVEYSLYNGNYYGCSKAEIAIDKVVILDSNGLKAFNDLHDDNIISIYLKTSEELRYQRMIERGDSKESVLKRINNDRVAFSESRLKDVDFVIDNNDIPLDLLVDKVYNLYMSKIKK